MIKFVKKLLTLAKNAVNLSSSMEPIESIKLKTQCLFCYEDSETVTSGRLLLGRMLPRSTKGIFCAQPHKRRTP